MMLYTMTDYMDRIYDAISSSRVNKIAEYVLQTIIFQLDEVVPPNFWVK